MSRQTKFNVFFCFLVAKNVAHNKLKTVPNVVSGFLIPVYFDLSICVKADSISLLSFTQLFPQV